MQQTGLRDHPGHIRFLAFCNPSILTVRVVAIDSCFQPKEFDARLVKLEA
ncbi:hypothetical protein ACKFKF_32015 [Phormidesmis sp. 146-12]